MEAERLLPRGGVAVDERVREPAAPVAAHGQTLPAPALLGWEAEDQLVERAEHGVALEGGRDGGGDGVGCGGGAGVARLSGLASWAVAGVGMMARVPCAYAGSTAKAGSGELHLTSLASSALGPHPRMHLPLTPWEGLTMWYRE